jgi:hypothetical protein
MLLEHQPISDGDELMDKLAESGTLTQRAQIPHFFNMPPPWFSSRRCPP